MRIMFLELGFFSVILVIMMFFQIYNDSKKYRDSLLFSRLLLAIAANLSVDTAGWLADGNPFFGQIWITTLLDGLDLILTATVCWCWGQYALYLADEKKQTTQKKYKDFCTLLLMLQIILVSTSQVFHYYYYVDEIGVYHRISGYFMHSTICVSMLLYSSITCFHYYKKEQNEEKKKELFFMTYIIIIPIIGDVMQMFTYGFPTIFICMVLMIFVVYIHIHNKRIAEERQEQNKILKAALVEAQSASAAKTEFFARMSHDMRTPMNGILGIANLSLDEKDYETLHSNIGKIKTSGEYMLGLINDTLDFQKIESGKLVLELRVISANEMLESICSMVRETAKEKDVEFKIVNRNADFDHYIKIDPLRTKQIFINLLSNAIKFTPPGGTVELELEKIGSKGKISQQRISVTDTGIGMTKEFLEEGIFKPFSQEYNEVTAKTSGTGLGLSISKQLVELMGGTITVDSEIGSGTRFEVTLSFEMVEEAVVEKNTEASTEQKAFVEHALQGRRILLAEDHPLNAEIAKKLLQKVQCDVTWSKNGQECVEQLLASAEDYYDVILMDIRMPVMDGLEAARTIRAINRTDAKRIPIIAMTANAYEEDMKQSAEAGMNAHLAKPVEPQLMYETIARYIQ